MSSEDYKRYLASREWGLLKEQVRARSQGWCERCGVAQYQETHHVTYARVGRERLEDLLGVCSPCHRFLSAKADHDPKENVGYIIIAVDKTALPSSRDEWRQVGFFRPDEGQFYFLTGTPEHLKPWAPDAKEFNASEQGRTEK